MLGEANLESKKKANDFATLLASVDVVTKEEVTQVSAQDLVLLVELVLVRHLLEHVQQVAVLTVNVAEDLDRRLKLQ